MENRDRRQRRELVREAEKARLLLEAARYLGETLEPQRVYDRFREIPYFRWYCARAYFNLAYEKERIRLFTLQVAGVPDVHVEEALWTAVEAAWPE